MNIDILNKIKFTDQFCLGGPDGIFRLNGLVFVWSDENTNSNKYTV